MTDAVTLTTEAVTVARKALDLVNSEKKAAIRAETQRIETAYRERIEQLSTTLWEATKALDEAKIAEANTNPMVGKKVQKTFSKPVSAWSSKSVSCIAYGIVEVVTPQTKLPSNMGNWRRPDDGDVIVRLLKADGTAGLKVEGFHSGWTEVVAA